MRLLLSVLAGTAVVAASGGARAQNFAHYERVKVSELKSGGKVIGARIKMTLRPDASGHDSVWIGIGPGKGGPNANNRILAADPKAGFLLHQFPKFTDFKANQPKEITLDLKYADAPKLTPGQDFQIVTAWGKGNTATHVFGMTRAGFVTEKSYKLPGKAAAQRKVKLDDIRRAGKRVGRNRPRTRPARKPLRKPAAQKAARRGPRR